MQEKDLNGTQNYGIFFFLWFSLLSGIFFFLQRQPQTDLTPQLFFTLHQTHGAIALWC